MFRRVGVTDRRLFVPRSRGRGAGATQRRLLRTHRRQQTDDVTRILPLAQRRREAHQRSHVHRQSAGESRYERHCGGWRNCVSSCVIPLCCLWLFYNTVSLSFLHSKIPCISVTWCSDQALVWLFRNSLHCFLLLSVPLVLCNRTQRRTTRERRTTGSWSRAPSRTGTARCADRWTSSSRQSRSSWRRWRRRPTSSGDSAQVREWAQRSRKDN